MRMHLGVMTFCLASGLLAVLLGPARAADADKEHPVVAAVKPQLTDPDKPFTLLVGIQTKEGAGNRFEAAFAKAARETHKEKGNLAYELNRDAKDPSQYVVYERWKSLADLETHLQTPYIKALLAELPEVTTGAPKLQVLVPVGK